MDGLVVVLSVYGLSLLLVELDGPVNNPTPSFDPIGLRGILDVRVKTCHGQVLGYRCTLRPVGGGEGRDGLGMTHFAIFFLVGWLDALLKRVVYGRGEAGSRTSLLGTGTFDAGSACGSI